MLLFVLLGVSGTVVVSQGIERLNLTPTGFRQHQGGLPEPLCLCGCCERLSPNSSEKGGEIMEIGQ